MAIELGITQWSMKQRDISAVESVRRLGLSCIQIDVGGFGRPEPFALHATVRRGYLSAAKAHDVKIAAMTAGILDEIGMTSPLGTLRRRYCWDAIQAAAEAADEMAIPLLYLPAFNAGEIKDEDDLLLTAEMLHDAYQYLRRSTTELAVETSLGLARSRQLLEHAQSSRLKVLFDTYNPVKWGHAPLEIFDGLAGAVSDQVQVKDGMPGGMGDAPIGSGVGRAASTLEGIIERGFDGYLLLEGDYRRFPQHLKADVRWLTIRARHP